MKKFEEFKTEILARAKKANACTAEYKAASESKDFASLFDVIKRNFHYCCINGIIDGDLIDSLKSIAGECGVYHNEDVTSAYLLATGNSTVTAYDNSTVTAYGNSTVTAYGNSTVTATGNSTVTAFGNSTVTATGNSTVTATGNSYINVCSGMDAKISDHAIMRYRDTNEVHVINGNILVKQL